MYVSHMQYMVHEFMLKFVRIYLHMYTYALKEKWLSVKYKRVNALYRHILNGIDMFESGYIVKYKSTYVSIGTDQNILCMYMVEERTCKNLKDISYDKVWGYVGWPKFDFNSILRVKLEILYFTYTIYSNTDPFFNWC